MLFNLFESPSCRALVQSSSILQELALYLAGHVAYCSSGRIGKYARYCNVSWAPSVHSSTPFGMQPTTRTYNLENISQSNKIYKKTQLNHSSRSSQNTTPSIPTHSSHRTSHRALVSPPQCKPTSLLPSRCLFIAPPSSARHGVQTHHRTRCRRACASPCWWAFCTRR